MSLTLEERFHKDGGVSGSVFKETVHPRAQNLGNTYIFSGTN